MSILIHGMKMPKDGECIVIMQDGRACKIVNFDFLEEYDEGNLVLDFDGKPVETSATELPPHGRLGDLDALFNAMFQCSDGSIIGDHGIDGWHFSMPYREIKRFIRHAPTIIEAEGIE